MSADSTVVALGGSRDAADEDHETGVSGIPVSWRYIDTQLEVDAALATLIPTHDGKTLQIGVDTETTGLDAWRDRLLLLQMGDGERNLVFDMTRVRDWTPFVEYLHREDVLFLLHNAKFDYSWLATKLDDWAILPRIFDTMLAERLILAGSWDKVNLAATAKRYLGLDMDKSTRLEFIGDAVPVHPEFTTDQQAYAALDVWVLPRIFARQAVRLQRMNLVEVAKLEFDLLKVVARMEARGVLIDQDGWSAEAKLATELCATLEADMQAMTSSTFNPRSPKQVTKAFGDLGFLLHSTNASTLKHVKSPLASLMLDWRKQSVLRDRYGEGWLDRLRPDGRIHGEFKQLGASTGRFSSANPNLQQLPRGDRLRKSFIAGPGRKLITADYSSIEVRILAELSGDENMTRMFAEGYDIHAATAKEMFRLDAMPAKDSKYRQMAKSVNFGLIYGAGPDNLIGQLAEQGIVVTKPEAEGLIKRYFDAFPQAKRWLDGQSKRAYAAIEDGEPVVTRTFSGRMRTFPVSRGMTGYERGHVARQSRNTPIQGSSADVTKNAMLLLDAELLAQPHWDASIVMTVHDELVVDCLAEFAEAVAAQVKKSMIEGAQRWMKTCAVSVDLVIDDCWNK